jgi:feruloyl esterase
VKHRRALKGGAFWAAALAAFAAVASSTAPQIRISAASPRVAAAVAHGSCEHLTSLRLEDTTIASATEIAGPSFTPPGSTAITNLPAFCRVVAVTRPAVRFEVWMPRDTWNGKFQGVGNGGTAGVISYGALAEGIRRGYATTSTDTGHVSRNSADAEWALGRMDLVADFGHRGLHVATVNGKHIATSFYTTQPSRSYYVGCSIGGQQGLMEAQRYPADYDGIIAGDPANNSVASYLAGHLWYALATEKNPEAYIPASKLLTIDKAVVAACDRIDGIEDGIIADPRQCRFDPSSLVCASGQDSPACLSEKQAAAIGQIWSGAKNSRGEQLYPGLLPGAESGAGASWQRYQTGTGPGTGRHLQLADGFLKYVLFQNPRYDFRTFDYDRDFPGAVATLGPHLDAIDPDLRPFEARGAKLIVYHGWNDPSIPALNTINYYESVLATVGGSSDREAALARTRRFFRLFMVPGMQHCSGGPGPDRFDMLSALETWVEQGTVPDRIVASHRTAGRVDRTRPLCPYPQQAVYTGKGSTDDAANFVCR